MIRFDDVTTALAATDPHAAMDALVRAELSGGRRTADIHGELFPHAKQIYDTLQLSKDAKAALVGVLDALTGDCDPDQCYEDPPVTEAGAAPHRNELTPALTVGASSPSG